MESMTEGGAKSKTKGALEGAKEKLPGGGDDDDEGASRAPAAVAARARARSTTSERTTDRGRLRLRGRRGPPSAALSVAGVGRAGAGRTWHGELAAIVSDAGRATLGRPQRHPRALARARGRVAAARRCCPCASAP